MIKRTAPLFLTGALCLAAAVELRSATLTGGTLTVSAVTSTSGSGTLSTGGTLSLAAAALGQGAAPAALSGGTLSLSGGLVPAIVVISAASPDLSGAHCYPVPFKPSAGHTTIRFQDLTSRAEIKIFTIAGELVRSISKADANDYIDWDVRNSRGEPLASGVFIYVIKSGGSTKKGKLMVIR